ncbi:hypothetical protein AB0D14_30735 [Streptomyces sp. NPDC048484]|uniref:hypothetical protein n=1 Tax=Streptomyces sp. NPDC048484 TaxID=3155146 RepID=UPI00341833A6
MGDAHAVEGDGQDPAALLVPVQHVRRVSGVPRASGDQDLSIPGQETVAPGVRG